MDEIVDIGVFSRPPGGEESDEKVLYLEKHHITGTDNTIELVLDEEPYEAGIDPYNKLVDRSSGDNRKRVTVESVVLLPPGEGGAQRRMREGANRSHASLPSEIGRAHV